MRRGSPYYIDWLIEYGKGGFPGWFAMAMNCFLPELTAYSEEELNNKRNEIANELLECKVGSENELYWEFMRQQSAYKKFKESFKRDKKFDDEVTCENENNKA